MSSSSAAASATVIEGTNAAWGWPRSAFAGRVLVCGSACADARIGRSFLRNAPLPLPASWGRCYVKPDPVLNTVPTRSTSLTQFCPAVSCPSQLKRDVGVSQSPTAQAPSAPLELQRQHQCLVIALGAREVKNPCK